MRPSLWRETLFFVALVIYQSRAQAIHPRSVRVPAQWAIIYDPGGEILANNQPILTPTLTKGVVCLLVKAARESVCAFRRRAVAL